MSSLSHLKGVRTRYRNILTTEIQNGIGIMSTEVQKPNEQQYVMKASKCAEKVKLYVEKLESQSGKVISAMEQNDEDINSTMDEDCSLCSQAMDCFLDLNQFKERLVEFIKKESEDMKEMNFTSEIVNLQKEMKDILKFQFEQKEQEKREHEKQISVKLPELI